MKKFKFPECRDQLAYISLVQGQFFNSNINENEDVEPIELEQFFFVVEDELGVFSDPHREKYTFTESEIKDACARAIKALR